MNFVQSLLSYTNSFKIGSFEVQFYAFFLLGGGLVALFLANYRAHKKGYPWDIYDTIFLWAFPAGVVGARIWYIIATAMGGQKWTFISALGITSEGIKLAGLAIQGGVIGGALAGILVVILRRKNWSILEACDYGVPTILIAQAIGRWGNFLNQEVYGQIVSSAAWGCLPNWVTQNMVIGGNFRVPLFFLEGLINIGGYFFLTRFIPLVFSKHYRSGDQLFLYFTWYGLVRALLEPLRDNQFQMANESGAGFMAAEGMSYAFIVIGIIGVIVNHLVRYYYGKKKESSLVVANGPSDNEQVVNKKDEKIIKAEDKKSKDEKKNNIK